MIIQYQKLSVNLVSMLPDRAKDIVNRRFGVYSSEPQTLEAVGQRHGITRERVRQIVEDSLRIIRGFAKKSPDYAKLQGVYQEFGDVLKNSGELKRQDLFIEQVNAKEQMNSVVFLLNLGEQFYGQRETEYFYPYWTLKRELYEGASRVIGELLKFFENRETPLLLDEILKDYLRSTEIGKELNMSSKHFPSFLEVSKHIGQGYNGKWGLRKWPEVHPKGMRDRAYVVLKELRTPLHFTDVAKQIAKMQESFASLKKKDVLPQTVHNELIKDERFVLVGRGTYALVEWGYQPGTVREVMTQILKEQGPLTREELIEHTLRQRRVKESTILLNLQDKSAFTKDAQGKYILVA